ncbi:hypothetical protein A3A79_04650 [Candidatus Gottesmanbacteria bacterium RIFCSPLOWO2_01_FULL_43_11b]|uniref:Membrane protein 6-pyruvoyl-tetrahydropterin synthase-related domain-containing protein n=1 Tax=Candidatus Gottesmanbacteria bacterium RIFCSPLOWO2_01_FULL_43_11b TaxID=1798392 RepID=A0A1F6AIA9_9BACT|nr:MAG: hypothetical protein A3A79_04650 [Candidatus Gottesmanbacteria bacterium RIFCSPLOWO2_01_FULL_43_11b]
MKFRFFVPFIFLLLSLFFFRQYFTQNKVPLPFNLLVSFYSPWKYEPVYGLSIPNKPLGDDNIKLFYPYRKFTVDELKKGRIPLWNPYTFSGSVNHAMYQSAVFYPLNLIYFLLPLVDAWSVIVMMTPVLAGLFMYLFLRSLKLSQPSSFFGSLTFALSGWTMAFWEEVLVKGHTILWLPLALYGINKKSKLILVIALVNAILAGFPQMIVYLFITVYLWALYRKVVKLVTGATIISLLLTAFQWVPAVEAFLNAPRGKVDTFSLFESYLTPLTHLVTFLAPDFWGNPGVYNNFSPFRYLQEHTIFIGIPAILFAVLALRNRAVPVFWKLFSLITLSMGFAIPSSWLLYTLKIPILNIAMPVRIFILATFGLCILAAYGIEKIKENPKFELVLISSIFSVLWGFVGLMIVLSQNTPEKIIMSYATISLRNLILPSAIFILTSLGIFFLKKKKIYLIACMSFLTFIGAFYFGSKILYFSERQYEYPEVTPIQKLKEFAGYNRVWSYGDGYIVRNIPSYFGLFSPEGYEALYSHRYGTLLHTIVTRGILIDRIQRTDATLSETGQYEPMTHNPVRLRLMSILGVKYILEHKDPEADKLLSPMQRFPADLFSLAWENDRWRIWEYMNVLGRTFIVSQTVVEEDPQKIVDALLKPETDLLKTIILEEYAGSFNGGGTAVVTEYLPSSVTISTETSGTSLLFLSDSYYPGWQAYVDDIKTPIYRANFIFRAVSVPEGTHTVRFVYDPLSWKLGLYLSSAGILIFFLWILRKQ